MSAPMEAKTVSQSRTTQVQIVLAEHINGMGRLFGGKLMEWIDITAAAAARRHSGCNVTTACIDRLDFTTAAFVNEMLVLEAQLTYVGSSSMEVRVDSYAENLDGSRRHVNRAYLVLVALDAQGVPTRVPRLIAQTQEEADELEAGAERNRLRKLRQYVSKEKA